MVVVVESYYIYIKLIVELPGPRTPVLAAVPFTFRQLLHIFTKETISLQSVLFCCRNSGGHLAPQKTIKKQLQKCVNPLSGLFSFEGRALVSLSHSQCNAGALQTPNSRLKT